MVEGSEFGERKFAGAKYTRHIPPECHMRTNNAHAAQSCRRPSTFNVDEARVGPSSQVGMYHL